MLGDAMFAKLIKPTCATARRASRQNVNRRSVGSWICPETHFWKTAASGKFTREIFPEQQLLGMDNRTDGQFGDEHFKEEHFKTEQFKADL